MAIGVGYGIVEKLCVTPALIFTKASVPDYWSGACPDHITSKPIRVFRIRDGSRLTLLQIDGEVTDLQTSSERDSAFLVSGYQNGQVNVWHICTDLVQHLFGLQAFLSPKINPKLDISVCLSSGFLFAACGTEKEMVVFPARLAAHMLLQQQVRSARSLCASQLGSTRIVHTMNDWKQRCYSRCACCAGWRGSILFRLSQKIRWRLITVLGRRRRKFKRRRIRLMVGQ
eukprot:g24240.t1